MIELALAVVAGMTLHEAAHAIAARELGDPTASLEGRVSLNPVRHLDPVGSVLAPAAAWLLAGIVVGWGRPVPIHRLLLTRRSYIAVLLAGPAANLYVAGVFALGGFTTGALANLLLAGFNLLPVPPLDGGRILQEVLR